jgi:hypothetical protein
LNGDWVLRTGQTNVFRAVTPDALRRKPGGCVGCCRSQFRGLQSRENCFVNSSIESGAETGAEAGAGIIVGETTVDLRVEVE